MPTLQILERLGQNGQNAAISFDHGPEYPLTLHNPVAPDDEEALEWYFEEHLRSPFVNQHKAQAVAAKIPGYGHALFEQIFAERRVYAEYRRLLQTAGVQSLRFEISGSPEFNAWHWECLHDPDLPRPFAVEATMLRKNRTPQTLPATPRPSPTLNLLLVTARPRGKWDVAYRTISRPLLDTLRQSDLKVKVDLLRPGTYEALSRHLEQTTQQHGPGYYHIIHFDAHGAVLDYADLQADADSSQFLFQARFGRSDLPAYKGLKAFLFLESGPDNRADPVEAEELGKLLLTHQIPFVILNACQSGKQVGAQDTSLGARLVQAGARQVLAMAYSVTVSAARKLMPALYRQLFAGRELGQALVMARAELMNDKSRRAHFNQAIDLEDWLLPVLYEDQAAPLPLREFTAAESQAWYEKQGSRHNPPPLEYGFVGRDLDVLAIERRILAHNLLLIHGMGGAGKTSLLHHLAEWWQQTGFVDEVFYYGYDERAWTAQQIQQDIAQRLLPPAEFYGSFQAMNPAGQRARLAEALRGRRHLLLLDNLESISGDYLSIPNTLPEAEREALRVFLAALSGGKTLALLGSRSEERWLAPGVFGDAVHELAGLDAEAASDLADKVLERHGASRHRDDPDLQDLLALLAGYPLALQVVLSKLATDRPAEVLEALRAGDVRLDRPGATHKTESLLACIDYAYGPIATPRQKLLLCLAPFALVVCEPLLPQYSEALRRQGALADLPFEDWKLVLAEAAQRGLLSQPPEAPGFLTLQPVFPYFLRGRLNTPGLQEMKKAIEVAFYELYCQLSGDLARLMHRTNPQEQILGFGLAELEYENLFHALEIALALRKSIKNPYAALYAYIDRKHDEKRGLWLGQHVLHGLEAYPKDSLQGAFGLELVGVVDSIAKRQLFLKRFGDAEISYQKALDLHYNNTSLAPQQKRKESASLLHQLGMVARKRQQWAQAQDYYQQAVDIFAEFNDRQKLAGTNHELGILALEQRQWLEAQTYCQKALAIYIELNDHHGQAASFNQMGYIALAQRQWVQAETLYKKALAIFIKFNNRYEQAGTYHQLGWIALEQQQWAQSQDYFQKALAHKIGINDRYGQASTYHQLGNLAAAQEQFAQAQNYYQKSLEIKIEFNDHYEQASTYQNLGLLALAQGQWEQAGLNFRQALILFTEYLDQHNQNIVLRSLSILWQTNETPDLPSQVAEVLGLSTEEIIQLFKQATDSAQPSLRAAT